MKDIEYGKIYINLERIMKEQNVSINRLSYRAEMQRTQLRAYIKNDIQRVDLSVLARLCFVLEVDLNELIEYIPPESDEELS